MPTIRSDPSMILLHEKRRDFVINVVHPTDFARFLRRTREIAPDDADDVRSEEIFETLPTAIAVLDENTNHLIRQDVPDHQSQIGRQAGTTVKRPQKCKVVRV